MTIINKDKVKIENNNNKKRESLNGKIHTDECTTSYVPSIKKLIFSI